MAHSQIGLGLVKSCKNARGGQAYFFETLADFANQVKPYLLLKSLVELPCHVTIIEVFAHRRLGALARPKVISLVEFFSLESHSILK